MTARNKHHEILFERHGSNPILTAAQWPYATNSVFNPGAIRLHSGETILLCRVEDRRGFSHLHVARSTNGIDGWEISETPTFVPDPKDHPDELWGVEDPRITFIEELGKYAIAYTAFGWGGPGVSLALTEDFVHFERLGMVFPPDDKDAALFPRRIDGRWAMIHRPVTNQGAHIWISYSPDLRHWGDHRILMEARRGGWWDAGKIGLSPPLIETERGWIMIYHGVRTTASGSIYRIGIALFDLEKPEKCILRGDKWVFGPFERSEREGDVDNVVFPCGYTIGDDGDTINLYYGAADTSICLATGSIQRTLDWLDRHGLPESHALHTGE